jgi:hypothetical protein
MEADWTSSLDAANEALCRAKLLKYSTSKREFVKAETADFGDGHSLSGSFRV